MDQEHRGFIIVRADDTDACSSGCMPQRIVEEIGQRLAKEALISPDYRSALCIDSQPVPARFEVRRVGFAHFFDQYCKVDRSSPDPLLHSLDLCNPQQGRKYLKKLACFTLRAFDRILSSPGILIGQSIVKPIVESCQRSAKVVRDIARYLPKIVEKAIDAFEHQVDRHGQAIELAAGAIDWNAPGEVSGYDCQGGGVDPGEASPRNPSDQQGRDAAD